MKTFVGIDWSKHKHDIQLINAAGANLSQFQIKHNPAGFRHLVSRLRRHSQETGDCLVGIETADNRLVDYLREQDYTVYVLPSSRVNAARGTHRSSGARDDSFDAWVIAELLRRQPDQFVPWRPDSVELQQMRLLLSWLGDLTEERVQLLGRLHALLHSHYPQIPAAFANLDGQVAMAVLSRYPSAAALKKLTRRRFETLCKKQRFYGRKQMARYWTALQQAQPTSPLQDTAMLAMTVSQMVEQMQLLKSQKQKLRNQLSTLFDEHEDAFIFRSLPGTGALLGPSLLAIFGEDRERWPTAEMLAATSGTVPVTKQSGNWRYVHFRRACNRRYRQTWQLFARSSTQKTGWAADYFQTAVGRGHRPSQAYRMLANRWVRIVWTLWQRRIPYDETVHLEHIHKHRQPQS